MNKEKVVSHLVALIWQQFNGVPRREIESALVEDGWSIGAVREAIKIYRSARQLI